MNPETEIKFLKGVGERRAALLKRLGVTNVDTLLRLYPRTYEDWSKIVSIANAPLGETCCIKAYVGSPPRASRIRQGLTLYKCEATDGESIINITIFNSKYSAEKLAEGGEFLFFGKVGGNMIYKEMNSPEIERAGSGERIRPIYPQTEGLNSRTIEKLVRTALINCENSLEDPLPVSLKEKYFLMSLKDSLWNIHFPKDDDFHAEAKKRLIFEELLVLQLGLIRLKGRNRALSGAVLERDFSNEYFSLLPFEPTKAQRRAVAEAIEDMTGALPMCRLLQGDVGSGKTAVAAALIYSTVKNSMQCALMVPTEILAQQHYETVSKLFEGCEINVELLTGSTTPAQKKRIKAEIKEGKTDLIIGTHALIEKDVEFCRLGLICTDEQHRFGVGQRSTLSQKGENPHTLVMSATPIPRTLALIIYGDLDVSILDELPPGRQRVETFAVDEGKRERAFNYVKKHLNSGLQGYVVCPLVEEGEMELAAATEYAERLKSEHMKGYSVGLLHGKMKAADKKEVMKGFAEGKIQLLVSTTVIEVGVDVPNAVIMIIENAERFGLSQLHQLRGRIGRGSVKSTCIMISNAKNGNAAERMKIMCETSDGFKIAEQDLKLRGPGDFFGARQHGLPELKIADMLSDTALLKETQNAARLIAEKDSELTLPENANLKKSVKALFSAVGETGLN